jgi:sugar phosphate permease
MNERKKELRLIFGLFTGYACYSLLRKSLSVSVPFMRTSLNLTKTDIGNISTSFSIAYGVSKFVGGVVSDFLPADILFAAGLFLAALANFFFSFSVNTNVLCFLWSMNGLIQGKYI